MFNRVGEEDVSFELLFDATGVIPAPAGQSYANGVTGVIGQFMGLLVNFDGEIHSPNYLTIGWAQLQFDLRAEQPVHDLYAFHAEWHAAAREDADQVPVFTPTRIPWPNRRTCPPPT